MGIDDEFQIDFDALVGAARDPGNKHRHLSASLGDFVSSLAVLSGSRRIESCRDAS
jgi:hypothetical protein